MCYNIREEWPFAEKEIQINHIGNTIMGYQANSDSNCWTRDLISIQW